MTREEAFNIYEVVGSEIIDSIYDDFESRVCENCKYMNKDYKISEWQKDTHFKCEALDVIIDGLDFGCNKFERKIDVNV